MFNIFILSNCNAQSIAGVAVGTVTVLIIGTVSGAALGFWGGAALGAAVSCL